jgi:hypothetical protein
LVLSLSLSLSLSLFILFLLTGFGVRLVPYDARPQPRGVRRRRFVQSKAINGGGEGEGRSMFPGMLLKDLIRPQKGFLTT